MHLSPDRKIAVAEGNVEIAYGDALLTADRATFFTDTHDAYAEGKVRIEDGTDLYHGEMIHYNFDSGKGRFLRSHVASRRGVLCSISPRPIWRACRTTCTEQSVRSSICT
jgi:lipopolysaccharide assembly outer membrane protein LptD (OstA)